jgi:centromere/kinetochore protein ZW10
MSYNTVPHLHVLLFSSHDALRFVKSWSRFRELILVLNASLKEIEERWSGGKGPLAQDFTVEEMKQLIRALFQNTERRAAVLARIKFE